MGLVSLSIRNFRGVTSLKLYDFAKINVFGGRNNSGKSSILEAISLLATRGNASAFPKINMVTRGIPCKQKEDLIVFFKNEEQPIEILASLSNGYTNSVRTNIETNNEGEIIPDDNNGGASILQQWSLRQHVEDTLNGTIQRRNDVWLRQNYKDKKDSLFTYNRLAVNPILDWPCLLMSTNSRPGPDDNKMFEQISIALQDKEVSKVISAIYPEISGIRLVNKQMMVEMKGQNQLLPANVAGDGVVRIISILCGLWACRKGCLCVDEIDNGLHFSVLLDFWQAVFDFAERFDVQLFATTHHRDVLETLAKVASEQNKNGEVAYYRLSISNGAHCVARFTGNELNRALDMGFEVRG